LELGRSGGFFVVEHRGRRVCGLDFAEPGDGVLVLFTGPDGTLRHVFFRDRITGEAAERRD
jgi:hypothetical protein